jgi:hypothetical protein
MQLKTGVSLKSLIAVRGIFRLSKDESSIGHVFQLRRQPATRCIWYLGLVMKPFEQLLPAQHARRNTTLT